MKNHLLIYILLFCFFTQSSSIFAKNKNIISNKSTDKPNIILIFADDLGFGDLSCYGHPTIHTPRLDKMAQEGIKLTAFYTAASVCTPSRAALLTGRYPLRVGMPGNLGPDSPGGLSLDERTLAEALKGNGYKTAAFGKWHLGAVEGYLPTNRGFDEYLGILYSNDMMPPWVRTKRPLSLYRNNQPVEHPVDQTTLTHRYTDETIRVIKESGDQPFFVYLPYAMPHLPVYASKAFRGRSAGGRYGDVIEEMDNNVGRILDALKMAGKEENTLVIFTSDNGPWRNMPPRMYTTEPVEKWHGGTTGSLSGAKATSMEGGQRVPCIIRWPNQIEGNQVSAKMVTAMDLHATILDLTGTKKPEKKLDGKNIWALLTKDAPSPHPYFYYFKGKYLEGIRDAKWKLRIASYEDGWTSPELPSSQKMPVQLRLYHMQNDPFEQFDLAGEYPDVVVRLEREMQRMGDEIGAEIRRYK
jgi:arylsulfatase A-like enzyme